MKMILAMSMLLVALGSAQAVAQDNVTAPGSSGSNAASTNSSMTSVPPTASPTLRRI